MARSPENYKRIGPPTSILIVGGGVFGQSTALHLATGPYKGHEHLITVIDRSANPPDTNAACFDMNKIVRADYTDRFYMDRAYEAIKMWREPGWNKTYHESGYMLLTTTPGGHPEKVVRESYNVCTGAGMACAWNDDPKSYPIYPVEPPSGSVGYRNSSGGWSFSIKSLIYVRNLLKHLGVQFKVGNAQKLLVENNDVAGVACADGKQFRADITVLCCGPWTPAIYPKLDGKLLATGHIAATIQLTPEEQKEFAGVPVVYCVDTGYYIFPPSAEGHMKMAIHGKGYINPENGLQSIPCAKDVKTDVPEQGVALLQHQLGRIYPRLKNKKIERARVCWYSDSPTADFVFDYDEEWPSLFIAGGDSGHGFKFLPNVGAFITKGLQRRFDLEEYKHWSLDSLKHAHGSHLDDSDSTRVEGVAKNLLTEKKINGPDLEVVI